MKQSCRYIRLKKCLHLIIGVLIVLLVMTSFLISNLEHQIINTCTDQLECQDKTRGKSSVKGKGNIPQNTQDLFRESDHSTAQMDLPKYQSDSSRFVAVGPETELFVYSAFYVDTLTSKWIRLIAITYVKSETFPVKCLVRFESEFEEVLGMVELVPEPKYGYKYRSALISCPVITKLPPISVSLMLENTLSLSVNVTYSGNRKSTITRCYPALYSSMNDISLLIQSIEISRSFGVDYFVFYNYSIGPEVSKILQFYQKQNLVKMVDWQLLVSARDIHYFGQVATLHDCLYRNRKTSQYIFFGDLDELLVPKKFSNYVDLLQPASSTHKHGCGAWIFQHAFFPTFKINFLPFHLTLQQQRKPILRGQQNNISVSIGRERFEIGNLTFLEHTIRSKIHSVFDRSKYIVVPEKVEMLGIHKIERFLSSGYCFVKEDVALLHHYRSDWAEDMIPKWTRDTSILNFSKSIEKHFQRFNHDFMGI